MKAKKLLSFVLAAAMTLTTSLYVSPSLSVRAEDTATYTSEDGNYEYSVLADGTAALLSFYGSPVLDESAGNNIVALPDTIDGKVVSKVCSSLFEKNENNAGMQTTLLIFPSKVQTIEPFFMSNMELLGEIQIDESNQYYTVKDHILYNKDMTTLIRAPRCLTSLDGSFSSVDYTVPDSVTKIAEDAFSMCNAVSSISIPASVTTIGSGAFFNMTHLKAIEVADGNKAYTSQDGVLYTAGKKTLVAYPIGLCNEVSDPDDFFAFPDPIDFVVPEGVETIGSFAFYNCTSSDYYSMFGLSSITFPSSLKTIESWAFANCSSLSELNFSDGLKTIDSMAFMLCVGLSSLEIPDSVEEIGDYAFDNCKGLKTATIPSSVTNLGESCIGFMDDSTTFEPVAIDGFKLTCDAGSAAEEYAKKMNLSYELRKTNTPTPTPTATPTATPATPAPSSSSSAKPTPPEPTLPAQDSPAPTNDANKNADTGKTPAAPTVPPVTAPSVTVKKPAKPSWRSLKSSKKKTLTAKWKKVSGAAGYQVQYSLSKKFKKAKIKTVDGTKTTLRSLKRKKKYYVRIRSFVRNGKTNLYSSWSKVRKIKVK